MSADEPRAPFKSGRLSREAAGWRCQRPADLRGVVNEKDLVQFSWIDPRPLLQSRNDRLARWLGDPVIGLRHGWVEAMRTRPGRVPSQLRLRRFEKEDSVSFVVLGDTGEGDRSQYHVVRPLQKVCEQEEVDFMFIVSDVIYPAGDIHEYELKFYKPYSWFPGPIYAVPGNHDWYDGLEGFMCHFCGARKEECPPRKPVGKRWQQLARRLTWRKAAKPDGGGIAEMQKLRGRREQQANQPGPYFALDAGPVLLVGLDTGIDAFVDAEQGRWLRDISQEPKPKILLTGKPLYVNGACGGRGKGKKEPIMVEGDEGDVPLLDLVNDPAHDYVAVIGGDIHNYQRYAVALPDGRTIQHLISGAGGAYTHATHTIPKVELDGCAEEDFRSYPLRGDSLAVYSILYDNRIRWWRNWRNLGEKGKYVVPNEQAPKIMSDRLEIPTTRPQDEDVVVTPEARRAAEVILGEPGRLSGALHQHFSEFLDWDEPEPPLFKSMIRLDITGSQIEIRCFGATGCEEHADDPRIEDWVIGHRGHDGRYSWIDRMAELADTA